MTSHDVVARVRRALRPSKIKVGHAGTLDPDATGLLLICIGSATRLADLLADQGKTYRAEFTLGVTTTTEDESGEVVSERDTSNVTRGMVEEALKSLTGEIQQIPPMVSALHHEGKRLYELARQGIEVERAARTIVIDKIDFLSFTTGERPVGEIIVECGKGTYIRTLCADLGDKLGVGGHMKSLRRLKIGVFDVANANATDEISAESITERLVPASEAVSFLPLRLLTNPERSDVLLGRSVLLLDPLLLQTASEDRAYVRLVDQQGELVALGICNESEQRIDPKKVLAVVG